MMNKLQRGFTLIELLVVIAIIGILAAVVLASLNDARDGGQDASIKQSIGNARSQAELVYNQAGFSYATVCASPAVTNLMQAAVDNRAETAGTAFDAAGVANTVTCNDTDSGYALFAPLNIDPSGTTDGVFGWCVDSTGFAGNATTTAALTAADDITCN